jgi:hypothetical protein
MIVRFVGCDRKLFGEVGMIADYKDSPIRRSGADMI